MGQKNSISERPPNPIEVSPLTLSSQHLNQNIEELGLHFRDSCIYSPIKKEHDMNVIDKEWFLKFRVGINLFNRFPQEGVEYLIKEGFVADCPTIMACFLLNCVGLNKYKISCFLANEEDPFSIDVLRQMAEQMNISNMTIDEALRFYQKNFHLSGNKKKVELMLQVFSRKYVETNPDAVDAFRNPVKIVSAIACALVVLNTELNLMPQYEALSVEDFCSSIEAMVEREKFPEDMLTDIYNRVKKNKFTFGWDYYSEIYNLPIFSFNGQRVELSTSDRRFVYDFVMHAKRSKNISRCFQMCRRSYHVHVLIFNDSLAVLTKQRDEIYELRSFFYLKTVCFQTDCKESSCFGQKYYICFEDYMKNNFRLIRLFTTQEKKLGDFVKVLSAIIEEVRETEKVIRDYKVENRRQSVEKNEPIHF